MNSRERIPSSVHVALIAVQLMFASLSIVAKIALREIGPFGLICARASLAALVLVVARALMRSGERVATRHLPELAACALFGITANMLLFIAGLSRTTATNAIVIGTTIPVFTVGVAVVLRKEAATLPKVLGLVVACLGAMVIVGAARFESAHGKLVGNLLIVGNSLSFSIYLVLSRRLLAIYSPMTVVSWTFVFGALGILPFGAASLAAAAPHLSPRAWSCIAYIVAFPTVGTYFLNLFALRRVPASLVAIYIYVQPVVGALMAAAMLGERPSPSTFVGGALIGAGIWLTTREARRVRALQAGRA
ncbi:MAG TPA: DMT family transporter [Polyangia bacterium]|nr:DMT family transporter [Polyangia bacterium]